MKTYGKNLTWYFLEKLVQRYDDGSAPFAGQSEHVYDYTNANYSKGIITDIWNSMYETIANVNNLIARLDKNGQEVITTPGSWELMKGEALALRAFLHFDLLRMYGPVYKEEPEKECIPYRKEFKPETSPLLSASQSAGTGACRSERGRIPIWHKTPSTGATMLKTPSKHTGDTV